MVTSRGVLAGLGLVGVLLRVVPVGEVDDDLGLGVDGGLTIQLSEDAEVRPDGNQTRHGKGGPEILQAEELDAVAGEGELGECFDI